MSKLKDDLSGLKSRLENIEDEFENKLKEVESKESKFKRIDEQIEELINKKDQIVRLNVGGQIYMTKVSTLLSTKDTLFYKIVSSNIEGNNTSANNEIFFDRSYSFFPVILDYLRTKTFSPKGFNKHDLEELKEEAEYYGIDDILTQIDEIQKEVEFVGFTSSGRYSSAGTHSIVGLNDKSMLNGICAGSPYWIVIELNFEHEFETIEVGGWIGNTSLWYPGNGANSKILTSRDNSNWTNVGSLPSNFGSSILTVKLSKSTAKYIKFQHTSYVGIGYLNIIRC